MHTGGRITFRHQKEIEAARPRYELLARIEQAQDIRDVYMEQRNARKQIDAGRSRLGEIEVAIRQNAALQTSANVQWEAAQKELAEFKTYCRSKNRNWIKPEHWMCSWWKIESN